MKYRKYLTLLVAVFLAFGTIVQDGAMAISEDKEKGCLNDDIFKSNFLPRFVFVDRDTSPINVRESPTINSPIVFSATPGWRVFPKKQILGDDGYCWLQVTVSTREEGSFSGWVRGDLVIIRFGS